MGLDLSKPNVSSHFIISAVIVPSSRVDDVEREVRGLEKSYFQGSPLKSNLVGKKDERRLKILRSLIDIDFRVCAVVVDKGRLHSEGFGYRESFFKYTQKLLHNMLINSFRRLQMTADNFLGKEFMAGFKQYVKSQQDPELFDHHQFDFSDSSSRPLLGVADFVAGSLARFYERAIESPQIAQIMQVINRRILRIEHFPVVRPDRRINELKELGHDFDEKVSRCAYHAAQVYIIRHRDSPDDDVRVRVACLRRLLHHFCTDPNEYVLARDLMEAISFGQATLTDDIHSFRSDVIAKLRDSEVLIASSEKGYKIPSRLSDCRSFLSRTRNTVEPLLSRTKRFRDILYTATSGDIDIFDPDYDDLKKLCDAQR